MVTNESPQPNFIIGQMADDLVNYTITICTKSHDKQPRFPYKLYNTYVDVILGTALDIQKAVYMANAMRNEDDGRYRLQEECSGNCIYLCHLIRIAFDRGWISDKQRDKWVSLTSGLRFKVLAWMKYRPKSNP